MKENFCLFLGKACSSVPRIFEETYKIYQSVNFALKLNVGVCLFFEKPVFLVSLTITWCGLIFCQSTRLNRGFL